MLYIFFYGVFYYLFDVFYDAIHFFLFQYRLDIHKENCMQENLINSDEGASAACIKTCTSCNMSFSTVSEYKMHIKEHKKVSLIYNILMII